MFARDSMLRTVDGEAIVLAGAGRALLMQVAHPLVAQGVAEHSDYRHDRLGRLLRTLRPMYAIVFGTPEEARAAARGVNAAHRPVAGPGYRARDPNLLLWVHATLVDSARVAFERFVRPLGAEEAERYYEETKLLGRMLGVPPDTLPPDLPAFDAYLDAAIGTLEVGDTARDIARELLRPVPPFGPLTYLMRELTSGLLPAHIRGQYGFGWGPAREALLEGASRASRAVWPRLPAVLRRPPEPLLPASARLRYRRPSALGWARTATVTLSGAPYSSTSSTRSRA